MADLVGVERLAGAGGDLLRLPGSGFVVRRGLGGLAAAKGEGPDGHGEGTGGEGYRQRGQLRISRGDVAPVAGDEGIDQAEVAGGGRPQHEAQRRRLRRCRSAAAGAQAGRPGRYG